MPAAPVTTPQRIAAETFLIPHLMPAGPDTFLPVNSMLIRGEQPVVVDTGAPIHRDQWFEKLLSLVDPSDVRWIFVSHDDSDHVGNLYELLEICPNATLVGNFFMTERMSADRPLPVSRMRWLGPGESLDVGDRRLHLTLPPIYDAPTTRGLYDDKTAVMWAADAFASMTPGAVHDIADIPASMYDETFTMLNSMVSPWHEWLDVTRFRRHCDDVESLGLLAVASAHGPVLTGHAITDAFDRVRNMAGAPAVTPPGQSLLDEILATAGIALEPVA